MNMRLYIFIYILSLTFFIALKSSAQPITSAKGSEAESLDKSGLITQWIENIHVNHYFDLTELTEWGDEVQDFYSQRNYKLAWYEDGTLSKNVDEFKNELKEASGNGFPDSYYTTFGIDEAIEEINYNPEDVNYPYKIVQLDILLTKAFLQYGSDLTSGLLKPEELNIVWETHSPLQNPVNVLSEGLKNHRIEDSFDKLKPKKEQYQLLKEAYHNLQKQKKNGGWPVPGEVSTLEEKDSSKNVLKIKKYLLATGDLTRGDSLYLADPVFDERLTAAVERFQRRHGLKVDGIVGGKTLQEMNQPIDYRLDQVRINLDRLRWEGENPHDRYIIINIPDYSMKYYENEQIEKEMGVVVGENENFTPSLKDTIDHIIVNPTWNVPYSIASEEMLPKIKADPGFLSRNNYVLLRDSYWQDENVVDPYSVNWSKITEDNFPFFIVQQPGDNNALGRIKFMLPNNFSIYLHDTPATHLFNRAQRDFSHGCIRLEEPFELAYTLLEGQKSPGEIRDIHSSRETETIMLDKKVPVHVRYHTAWVDSGGQMHFREDVYDFDKSYLNAFNQR